MSSLLSGLTGFSSSYLISWMVTNLKVPSLFGRQKSQCSIEMFKRGGFFELVTKDINTQTKP